MNRFRTSVTSWARVLAGVMFAVTLPAASAQAAWSVRDAGTTAGLWGAAYRIPQTGETPGGQLVVVGERGVILTSADEGQTWTARASGTTAWLTAVTYDSRVGRFFAVGDAGVILASIDGVTWTREVSPTTVRLNGVGRAVFPAQVSAVGEAGAGLLTRAADGTWTQVDAGFGARWMRGILDSAAAGQGGAMFSPPTSEQGAPPALTWKRERLETTADIEAVTLGDFFGGAPVAVGADGLILHQIGDERTWLPRTSGTHERLRGACYKSGGFLRLITNTFTLGVGEYFAVGTNGVIVRSARGVDWQPDSSPTTRNLNAVVATATRVVAVGDGGTIISTGGADAAPQIARSPVIGYSDAGRPFLAGEAAGAGALSYLWVALNAGAPRPVGMSPLRQELSEAPSAGSLYQLIVANAFGIVRSEPVAPHPLLNLSSRAIAGPGDATLISGFSISAVQPNETRRVLIRGVGPGLRELGVAGVLPAPRLSVFAGTRLLASNRGWQNQAGAADIEREGARAGAFPLRVGSDDSAVVLTLGAGNYTAQIESPDGATGVGLVEIYDLDAPTLARLTNLSTRAHVQNGDGVLIGGIVIGGGLRKRVLLRAAGPALGGLGLTSVLARPRLTLYRGREVVAVAGPWEQAGNTAVIQAAAQAVNAFPFAAGSADAAMVRELEPGAYTLHVTAEDGGRGVALVEVYEAP